MKILVYLDKYKVMANCGRGGPLGVGFYIYNLSKNCKTVDVSFIEGNTIENKVEDKIKRYFPGIIIKLIKMINRVISFRSLTKSNRQIDCFDEYDAIHFHTTKDMYDAKELLEEYKGFVLLTSHSPVPFHKEIYDEQMLDFEKKYMKKHCLRMQGIDSYAFRRADYITFPCPEAEESYINNWDEYPIIKNEKKDRFRYLPTGIAPKHATITREKVRESYCIPADAFLISFMGRHNEIKGYDILKNAAEILFSESEEYRVIAAGKEEPIKRLNHPYWVEVGYTKDPYSLIAASDMYFLPNRETYFDLVMLEALSLKKIVVASRTGGNKFFERNGVKGVFLYDTFDEAIDLIRMVKNMPYENKKRLEEENYAFFSENLTDEIFFDNYVKLIKEIGKENEI